MAILAAKVSKNGNLSDGRGSAMIMWLIVQHGFSRNV